MGKKAAGPGEVAPSFDWSVLREYNALQVFQMLFTLKRHKIIPRSIRMPQEAEDEAWESMQLQLQPQVR